MFKLKFKETLFKEWPPPENVHYMADSRKLGAENLKLMWKFGGSPTVNT